MKHDDIIVIYHFHSFSIHFFHIVAPWKVAIATPIGLSSPLSHLAIVAFTTVPWPWGEAVGAPTPPFTVLSEEDAPRVDLTDPDAKEVPKVVLQPKMWVHFSLKGCLCCCFVVTPPWKLRCPPENWWLEDDKLMVGWMFAEKGPFWKEMNHRLQPSMCSGYVRFQWGKKWPKEKSG